MIDIFLPLMNLFCSYSKSEFPFTQSPLSSIISIRALSMSVVRFYGDDTCFYKNVLPCREMLIGENYLSDTDATAQET